MNSPLDFYHEQILCNHRIKYLKEDYGIDLLDFFNEAKCSEITKKYVYYIKMINKNKVVYGLKYLRNVNSLVYFSFKVEELLFDFKQK